MFDETTIPAARYLSGGHVAPDPQWRIPASVHRHHELILVKAGRLFVEAEGRRVGAGAGTALLYPAGLRHAEWTDPDAPLESAFIGFACAGLDDAGLTVVADSRGRMARLTELLNGDHLSAHPAAVAQRNALTQALLAEFLALRAAPDVPLISNTRHYIRTHLDTPIRLQTLAALNRMSCFHFIRRYRAATGRTPLADVRLARAEAIRDLLVGSSLPLKSIAERVGLGDVYSLSRSFTRAYKIPPARYRALHRGAG